MRLTDALQEATQRRVRRAVGVRAAPLPGPPPAPSNGVEEVDADAIIARIQEDARWDTPRPYTPERVSQHARLLEGVLADVIMSCHDEVHKLRPERGEIAEMARKLNGDFGDDWRAQRIACIRIAAASMLYAAHLDRDPTIAFAPNFRSMTDDEALAIFHRLAERPKVGKAPERWTEEASAWDEPIEELNDPDPAPGNHEDREALRRFWDSGRAPTRRPPRTWSE